ncbi:hypothetical protein MnTg02_00956 [bacterium MnTg02]|nr:hypothetical protein MnTg02_00956 [bacterium MnTg02]
MPYSGYRPELMGAAALEPSGQFEAGSTQSFTLTYTAGRFGIDDTGSIKIGFRFATDFGPVQFADKSAPGYTSVEASNGAELDLAWEFKRNIRPWSRALYIGVKKHFLGEGDTITIRFGDKRFGSPGIRLQTFCERRFEFRVFVDAIATYDYVALPQSPSIEIVPGPPVTWRAVLPTLVRVGAPFRLSIKADDKWGNPSDQIGRTLKLKASSEISGLPDSVQFETGSFSYAVGDLRLDEPGDFVIAVADEEGEALVQSNPLRAVRDPKLLHFWGDIHGQSNETLGTNTARDYFAFGRDRSFLDICAHQGNDFQMTRPFWDELNALTAEFDAPGKFVAIPGYEWSANTAVGGDRNVFYRTEGRPIYRSSHAQIPDLMDEETDAHNAHELFEKLRDEDCVVFAHCGGRYADINYAHDGRLETAVEVHSAWGTFEWLLADAFANGYRVGIVANSDGHKGRPGASYPGASFFGAYGGLTCYLASELTRDAIFAAMRQRHHYGTTGTRLLLDVAADIPQGAELFLQDPALGPASSEPASRLIMGDIARVPEADIAFSATVIGSAPIERVDIFDGPARIGTSHGYDRQDLGARIRIVYQGAEYRGRARTTNWDGRLEIVGNAIRRTRMFNNWNLDRGFHLRDPQHADWQAVTTGNFGGFDLWLEEFDSGRINIETKHVCEEIALADIGFDEMTFAAGGLDRALKIYRLPDRLDRHDMHIQRTIPISEKGDTRLFVRVTQEDGHQAWSSPIYMFRDDLNSRQGL